MKNKRLTIPTIITISRICLVPVFTYLFIKQEYTLAIIILLIAGFSDFLDGFIARRFNMRSRLGSILDPTADKFFMLVSFISLSWLHRIPWFLTLIIIGRDLAISLGVLLLNLMKIRLYYRPTRLSKLTTATQISVVVLSFLTVLIENNPFPLKLWTQRFLEPLLEYFIHLAIIFTIITFFQYVYIGYKFYRYGERKEKVIGS